MRFLDLSLEDDVPDHSVLSRFRTRLTKAGAWDGLLIQINHQIESYSVTSLHQLPCRRQYYP
jgi:IS5 family transposase